MYLLIQWTFGYNDQEAATQKVSVIADSTVY